MRAVFVNYIHPDHPHVSSMRLSYFAKELAKKGHQILLITTTENPNKKAKPLDLVEKELASHNWSQYYHLPCSPKKMRSIEILRNKNLWAPIRKLLVIWQYLINNGIFCDWIKGSRPYWPIIIQTFKPDITLGVFGNTDSLVIAKEIASKGKIPWVMDMKDSWGKFIPSLLRSILAKRFLSAAGIITNSELQAKNTKEWFFQDSTVIYSGVSPSEIGDYEKIDNKFRIMLVGSVYDKNALGNFIDSIYEWLESLSSAERSTIIFLYAGADCKDVRNATTKLKTKCELQLNEYLKKKEYYQLCKNSTVNCYLWSPSTFHHKLIELLYLRRPVITYPGIDDEEKMLADTTNSKLISCTTKDELKKNLEDLWLTRKESSKYGDPSQLAKYTWEAQSEIIENFLCKKIKDTH